MNIPVIGPILSTINTAINGYATIKKIETEGKVEVKKAEVVHQINMAEQGQKIEADYDTIANEGMRYSWKDEYLVLVMSAPFIGSFIPRVQDYVLKGWEYIGKAPDWYQWSFIGIVSATFGIRWMHSKMNATPK